MVGLIVRIMWRSFVLLLGVIMAIATVTNAYPYLDKQLPAAVVILLLWATFAYFIIPGLVQLWRVVIKPDHLPVYVTTGDGLPSDPVNLAIVCRSEAQLIGSMEAAGWISTPRGTLLQVVRTLYASVFNKPYGHATMSSLYLFGRRQDLSFQLQAGGSPSPRNRHHVRFWQLIKPREKNDHHDFWHSLLKLFTRQQSQVWVGAATHDISLITLRRNFQLTHRMDADTNKERDFLIETLQEAGCLRGKVEDIPSGHELTFRGQQFGVQIIVDGRLKVVRLKTRLAHLRNHLP